MNLIIDRPGTLFMKDDTLHFKDREMNTEFYPIRQISNIFLYSEVNITYAVFRLLNDYRINLFLYDRIKKEGLEFISNHRYQGNTNIHQAEAYLNPDKRLLIAKKMTKAEIHNLSYTMMRYTAIPRQTAFYSSCLEELKACTSITHLMTIEAKCMKFYYSQLSSLLLEKDVAFVNRVARHAKDAVNQSISYLNGVLYNEILSLILECGMNPSISYVHASNDRGNSLMLDIADIYKPIFTGKTILTLVNRKELDFNEDHGDNPFLPKPFRDKLIKQFHAKLHQTVQKKGRSVSYETIMKEDIYSLRNFVNGKSRKLNFFQLT